MARKLMADGGAAGEKSDRGEGGRMKDSFSTISYLQKPRLLHRCRIIIKKR